MSLENTMTVLSAIPACLHAVDDLPDPMVHLRHQVRVQPQARRIGLVEVRMRLLRRVYVDACSVLRPPASGYSAWK